MTENLETDSYRINAFILHAALSKEPIFASFKKLCEIEKNSNMDYVDFEWKYYQYYYGNRDLTIERSSENSSPVTLSDLPTLILGKVMGESKLRDLLALRKVSRKFRNLVDSSEVCLERVALIFGFNSAGITFDDVHLDYKMNSGRSCTVVLDIAYTNPIQKCRMDRNFLHAMATDALTFLKNPRLEIDELVIFAGENGSWMKFVAFLKSQNVQLNVRSIELDSGDEDLQPNIDFLKPGTLEEIQFMRDPFAGIQFTVEQFDAIADTEQWKKAQKFSTENFPDDFGMEKLLNFKDIRFEEFRLSDRNMISVRDILLKSTQLESCRLGVRAIDWHDQDELDSLDEEAEDEEDDEIDDEEEEEEDPEEEPEVEERIDRIMSQNPAFDAETRRFSIPNSRHYFQLEFGKDSNGILNAFIITKKSDR